MANNLGHPVIAEDWDTGARRPVPSRTIRAALTTRIWLVIASFGVLSLGAWDQAFSRPRADASTSHATVQVEQGRLLGTVVEGGVAFKGVPYAAPPVGVNRWRAPRAASAWRGVRDASVFGPSCPQDAMGWNNVDAKRASEDCLSLNIWTPRVSGVPGQAGLPVMVWIHGGGFEGGSGGNNFNDGTKLMRHGVVVVTINYRLGVLGFLAHPDLARESPDGATGNYGLMDQVAALKWVHDNIEAFGGDPANVTAFGESAGAIAIGWLITSRSAHGLFAKAILESGNAFGAGMIYATRARAEELGQQFGVIAALRRLSPRTLIRRWHAFKAGASHGHVAGPLLDGYVLQEQPARALLDGVGSNVAVVVGSNSQEFVAGESADQVRPLIESVFGDQAGRAFEYYYPGGAERSADPLLGNAATQLVADVTFRCSAILSSRAAASAWMYQFEQPRSGEVVTAHAHELVYVWGNWGPEWALKQPMSPAELALLDRMQAYWTNFARTGDPNGSGLPPWPRYNRTDDPYLAMSAENTGARVHLRGDICPLYVEHWSNSAAYDALPMR